MFLALEFCEDPSVLGIFLIVKRAIVLIKILVPVILIILSMIQVAKAVGSSEENIMKSIKGIMPKVLAALVVFLVPTLIDLVLNAVQFDKSVLECYQNATVEKIKEAQDKIDAEVESK